MCLSNTHPKWWQLYLTFPLLIALFVAESQLEISSRGHQAVQIGILILVYGLIHLWLRANSSALSRMNREQYRGAIAVIQIPSDQIRETHTPAYSTFQIPASEIKGMLSETLEVDHINADSFHIIDEVYPGLNKE
jgi:hypothetical protein